MESHVGEHWEQRGRCNAMHDDPDGPEGVHQVVRRTSAMYAGWARYNAGVGVVALCLDRVEWG